MTKNTPLLNHISTGVRTRGAKRSTGGVKTNKDSQFSVHAVRKGSPDFFATAKKIAVDTGKNGKLCVRDATNKDFNPCGEPSFGVGRGYVANAAAECDMIVHVQAKSKTAAFALLKLFKTYIYIDVVCARPDSRQGSMLIQETERQGRLLGKSQVRLSALPHVICFYARKGFKKMAVRGNTCPPYTKNACENGCLMAKPLREGPVKVVMPPDCTEHQKTVTKSAKRSRNANKNGTAKSTPSLIKRIRRAIGV